MKKYLEAFLMILCCAGFFGFIYPELCLTSDTVAITAGEAASEAPPDISNLYNTNLIAPHEQIRFRFRIQDIINRHKNPYRVH